jgi:hypothetical protein
MNKRIAIVKCHFQKKNQIEKLYKESSFWNISHLNKILTCIMVLHMIYEPHTHMLLNYKRVVLKDFLVTMFQANSIHLYYS